MGSHWMYTTTANDTYIRHVCTHTHTHTHTHIHHTSYINTHAHTQETRNNERTDRQPKHTQNVTDTLTTWFV